MNHLKTTGLGLIFTAMSCFAMAQSGQTTPNGVPQSNPYLDSIKARELRLRDIGDSMTSGITQTRRIYSLKKFIPMLVKTLAIPGAYDYGFDSLKFMNILEPEDKSFRLLNWSLKYNDGTFRYYGAIWEKSDGPLKLIPLHCDTGSFAIDDLDTLVTGTDPWIGALYYKLITNKYKSKTFYTLLGWDGFNYLSDRKFVDILSFDEAGQPVFGAPVFDIKGKIKDRVVFYYSGNVQLALKYIPEYNLITFDHLVPPNPANTGNLFSYITDGSYDYLEFKKGKWVWGDDLFVNFKKPIKEAGN
jgi:hypothetical protein